MELPELHTSRLVIRLPTVADTAALLRFHEENRDHFGPWRPHWPADFFTAAYQEEQILCAKADFQSQVAVRLLMFDSSRPGTPLGMINFSNIVRGAAQYANVGYALDYREEGKGLMAEALRASLDYMFGSHNLHRVMANYIPHNIRSGALLRRLGFTVEGYARDYLLIDGKWQDHILTSLTNTAWTAPTP